MSIHFFEEDIVFSLKEKRKHKNWLKKIISDKGAVLGEVNYIFCSDEFLYEMNLKYLNHHTYTDIITFDNSDKQNLIEGDIFISIERVLENSKKNKVQFELELKRVLCHGILHLLGFKDKEESDIKKMREMENKSLSFFD